MLVQQLAGVAISVGVAVLAADLVGGIVHWFEDTYVHSEMPVVGKLLGQVAEDNRLHHTRPRAFLSKTWWQSSWDITLLAALVLFGAWYIHHLTLAVWVFAVTVANANQIHKWSHQNPQEKGRLVHALQKMKVLQTVREHGKHHTGSKDSHYCVITNVLNPVLEKIYFWRGLEKVIAFTTGAKPITSQH